MFVVIIVTSLVTIITLIITAALYLISLICDESDDSNPGDSLGIDTSDFSTTPSQSPIAALSQLCDNPNHHHHDHNDLLPLIDLEQEKRLQRDHVTTLRDAVTRLESDLDKVSELAAKSGIQPSGSKQLNDENQRSDTESISSMGQQPIVGNWPASATTQRTLITNQLGAPVSKLLFEDFDSKEVQLGGTALHWCKSRKSLDKLIKLGLPLEIVNKRNETALHVAVRRRKLQVLIGLLGYGAEIEAKNDRGETALAMACKLNDIYACQLLLVFDANIDTLDKSGRSARHYVSSVCEKHKNQQQLPKAAHLILAMLNEMGAKRCPKDQASRPTGQSKVDSTFSLPSNMPIVPTCSDGCSNSGTYNGNSFNRWPMDYLKESLYKRHMFSDIIEDLKKSLKDPKQKNKKLAKRPARMLCIDGGGMRGVIVCQMMIELEKYLEKPLVNYFDWIGGTSVGAFVSCALCKGTSLYELRRISFDVKDEVFSGNRPYNSKFLERVLKRTFGPTTRMSDIKGKNLAVTTVIADRDPCQLRLFRNYKSPADILERYGYAADMFDLMSGHSVVTRRQVSPANSIISVKSTTNSIKSTISKSTITAIPSAGSSLSSPPGQISVTFTAGPVSPSLAQKDTSRPVEHKTIIVEKTATIPQHHSATRSPQSTLAHRPPTDMVDEMPVQAAKDNQIKGKEATETTTKQTTAAKEIAAKNEAHSDYVIDENAKDPLLWQAVRASGAAPFFFKPYGPYLDGGIISNNPTMDMLAEFFAQERVRSFLRKRVHKTSKSSAAPKGISSGGLTFHEEPPSKLELVVSLGTGRGRVIGQQAMIDFGNVASGFATVFSPVELLRSIRAARDLFKKLMHRSCMTDDHVLDRAQAWCSSLNIPYFRINPPLTTIFSIDDKRDEQLINALWQTKLYMRAMRPQLKQLAELLDTHP